MLIKKKYFIKRHSDFSYRAGPRIKPFQAAVFALSIFVLVYSVYGVFLRGTDNGVVAGAESGPPAGTTTIEWIKH